MGIGRHRLRRGPRRRGGAIDFCDRRAIAVSKTARFYRRSGCYDFGNVPWLNGAAFPNRRLVADPSPALVASADLGWFLAWTLSFD